MTQKTSIQTMYYYVLVLIFENNESWLMNRIEGDGLFLLSFVLIYEN